MARKVAKLSEKEFLQEILSIFKEDLDDSDFGSLGRALTYQYLVVHRVESLKRALADYGVEAEEEEIADALADYFSKLEIKLEVTKGKGSTVVLRIYRALCSQK